MNERLQELRKRLLLHKDILIVVSNNANNDSLLAASALFCTLNQIASDGPVFNTVDCLVLGNLSEMQEELIGKTTVQRFIHELQPKNYVVKIPKDGRISKVKWKEENEYFNLFLTPSFGELSIDNILFEQTGLNYKFIILIGFDEMSNLGEIYSNNEKFFDNIPKAIIGGKNNYIEGNTISISESVPVSEIVYDFLKNLKVNLSKDTAQFLMNGFVESLDGFITNIQGKSTLNKMAELIDLGAEIISLDTAIGHKSSYTQLQLKQGIYANIKQDSSGILWSVIDNSELKSLQIEDEEINVSDKIPFNSYKGYGTAFILYEFSDGTVWGKIETEDLDLPKLLNGYESQVCHDGLVIKTDEELDVVESKLLKIFGSEDQFAGTNLSASVSLEKKEIPSKIADEDITRGIDEGRSSISILQSTKEPEEDITALDETDEGFVKPEIDSETEEFSDEPIINSEDNFGPPKIFNSGSFGGPFSGMGNNNK